MHAQNATETEEKYLTSLQVHRMCDQETSPKGNNT